MIYYTEQPQKYILCQDIKLVAPDSDQSQILSADSGN